MCVQTLVHVAIVGCSSLEMGGGGGGGGGGEGVGSGRGSDEEGTPTHP